VDRLLQVKLTVPRPSQRLISRFYLVAVLINVAIVVLVSGALVPAR
jgi:hypothetical protein